MNITILYQGTNFWRSEYSGHLSVTTFSGEGDDGSLGGVSSTKVFTSISDAAKWVTTSIEEKRSSGFNERENPSSSQTEQSNLSRKRTISDQNVLPSTQEPATKISKRGMNGHSPVGTSPALGVVDITSGLNGSIYSTVISGDVEVYDAMLVFVDIQKNTDKFIILQIIQDGTYPSVKYIFYERWGRTGTTGQSLSHVYDSSHIQDAVKKFNKVIQKKTGLTFEAAATSAPIQDKYLFVQQDYYQKKRMIESMLTKSDTRLNSNRDTTPVQQAADQTPAQWKYWVDDGVDGKVTGWYDYDENGNFVVEL